MDVRGREYPIVPPIPRSISPQRLSAAGQAVHYVRLEDRFIGSTADNQRHKALVELESFAERCPAYEDAMLRCRDFDDLIFRYNSLPLPEKAEDIYAELRERAISYPKFQRMFDTLASPLEHQFQKISHLWLRTVGPHPKIAMGLFGQLEVLALQHEHLQVRVDLMRQPDEMEFCRLHSKCQSELDGMNYIRAYQTYCNLRQFAEAHPAFSIRFNEIQNPIEDTIDEAVKHYNKQKSFPGVVYSEAELNEFQKALVSHFRRR